MKERREYRCTRNASYKHNCIGHDDIRERQGYYVWASSDEEAWEEMAKRYPEETIYGFTTQEWEGFNVVMREVRRDDSRN